MTCLCGRRIRAGQDMCPVCENHRDCCTCDPRHTPAVTESVRRRVDEVCRRWPLLAAELLTKYPEEQQP